jgi:methylated-DNA-[protein]-cysteine S-methyltransferase
MPLNLPGIEQCSKFQQKVLRVVSAIPKGKVSTYQSIAKKIGQPKAARAVGRVLATNPFPIIIPCHRVICSDGSLGGYQGGRKKKLALLKKEGVLIP